MEVSAYIFSLAGSSGIGNINPGGVCASLQIPRQHKQLENLLALLLLEVTAVLIEALAVTSIV